MENPPPPRAPGRILIPLGIAAAAFAAFLPALSGSFLNWDDQHNFVENLGFRGLGWSNLRWMFTYTLEHYIPITWMTFGLDYLLWGMDPRGYHLTSLLLHAANAALFFSLAETLLRRARPECRPGTIRAAAAVAALLFALHPLRVESVAWITERRDVLSGLFFLLTIATWLRAGDAPPGTADRRRWLAASVALFGLMVLSKAMGMTLPLVLLVLDVYPLRRLGRESARGLIVEKIPHAAIMIGAIALTWFTQTGVASIDRETYPLIQKVAQPGFRISFYVWKTLLPLDLAPVYHFHRSIGLPQAAGWAAVLAASAGLTAARKRFPSGLATWVSYLLLIAPVSGVLQTGLYYAADRYSYLACLPFALLAAGGFASLLERWPGVAIGLSAVLLSALGALSWHQTGYWKDSRTLWTRQMAVHPDSWVGYFNHASALNEAGDHEGALRDYNRCLELRPGHATALTNRGTTRLELHDLGGALEDYTAAIGIEPRYERAWNLRGLARDQAGDRNGARTDYDRALEIKPDYPIARTNRGFLRRNLGDLDGALADAEAALRADPFNTVALILRASVRRARGDLAAAKEDLDRAVQLTPSSVEALNNRATIFMQTGRPREALSDYERALALGPDNPAVLMGCAQALYLLGNYPAAAAELRKALDRAPDGWPLRANAEALLQKVLQPR
jgi:tetratricopeptide (TPR) repeat protein